MTMDYEAKKYIPGLGREVGIAGDELKLKTFSGSGTTASIAASGTLDVTITHDPLVLNVLPVVSTTTPNATVTATSVGLNTFKIHVVNSAGSAQTVAYTYSRQGI